MRPLTATELLDIWERGAGLPPVRQALALLAAACPESSIDALADLSIGTRDERLFTLRELMFGPLFIGRSSCPACDEKLELSFLSSDLVRGRASELQPDYEVSIGGRELRFRLPTSTDLLAGGSRAQLLDRCVSSGATDLPAPVIDELINRMALADPLADIQLNLSCDGCGHSWEGSFDIVTFFWREIQAFARGLLRDVHRLASAYGWSEAEILALSPARRKLYLEWVGA